MLNIRNPFEYEQATKLSPEEIRMYYVEDFNYSRFIMSRRNVFLVGERGTGKTMTLLYYSLPVQVTSGRQLDLSVIPVYVPCNTPLTHRREYELLDDLNAALVSEHFMVVSIMRETLHAVFSVPQLLSENEKQMLRDEIKYALNLDVPSGLEFLRSIDLALDKVNVAVQEILNRDIDDIKTSFYSFNSGIRALLACLARLEKLVGSHFSFMIDDAQLYNTFQIRALNSWISYRDNALFSFKVATTRVDAPPRTTASGGSILEGHDYTSIEMEQPYQNRESAFGQLARKLVKSRLNSINININPDEFFPESESLIEALDEARLKAEKEAKEKYPMGTSKQIGDYIYKYTRAIYFRDRSTRANLPPYSGFNLLAHLSTGVIRNLLNPCYKMYDRVLSESGGGEGNVVLVVPPNIQTEVILELSRQKWEWMQHDLVNSIEQCSFELAKYVYQMLDQLAVLFKKRLGSNISEPRAVEFTISGFHDERHAKLMEAIKISRKAQLIYTYRSSAKDGGKRETYYMPNKILWPERGLDPEGQHARVSIAAENLQNAAIHNREIPFSGDDGNERDLFSPKN